MSQTVVNHRRTLHRIPELDDQLPEKYMKYAALLGYDEYDDDEYEDDDYDD